jgi:hypothetical protein
MAAENGLCISGYTHCQFQIPWRIIYKYKDKDMECSTFNAVYIHNLKYLLSVNVSLKGILVIK